MEPRAEQTRKSADQIAGNVRVSDSTGSENIGHYDLLGDFGTIHSGGCVVSDPDGTVVADAE
jgi:hypothetical protein